MKRLILSIIALLFAVMAYTQECSTTWPYIYPEFQEGTIYMRGGQKITQKLNVHVVNGRLHYIDGEMVKEAFGSDILMIEIGEDKYMVVKGNVMKVVGSEEKGFVATHITADMASIQETGGAYGSSSSSSATMKLSSIDVSGANVNHMELRQNRNNGRSLGLKYTYYIITGGQVYDANKKYLQENLPTEKQAKFKSFLKEHKIKWKDAQSLLQLIDFINE